MTFVWNTVIDAIAALQNTGALLNSGIKFFNATPDWADMDNTTAPLCFPMDDPGGVLNSWTRISNTDHTTGLFRSKSDYTLHWIYLHTEILPDTKKFPLRPIMRANIAKIFTAITSHATTLGVEYVKPQIGSFDYNLTNPQNGRKYLGCTFSIECFEYANQSSI